MNRQPKYSIKEFSRFIGINVNTLKSRHRLGHKLPDPALIRKRGKGLKDNYYYNFSDLMEWHNSYYNGERNKNTILR